MADPMPDFDNTAVVTQLTPDGRIIITPETLAQATPVPAEVPMTPPPDRAHSHRWRLGPTDWTTGTTEGACDCGATKVYPPPAPRGGSGNSHRPQPR